MNLSTEQLVIIAFTLFNLLASALNPNSVSNAIGVGLSLVLFGLTLWLGREKQNRYEALEGRMRELSDKIQAMQLQKGMGR